MSGVAGEYIFWLSFFLSAVNLEAYGGACGGSHFGGVGNIAD